MRLNPDKFGSTESYLFHLYNDLGFSDLELSYNYISKEGDVRFSKWIRFDYLMSLNLNDKVEGTYDTKKEFINKVTHRSVLDIEVVYDFDEGYNGEKTIEGIKKYAKDCIKKLNDAGISGEVFFSGSKSIHYSTIFPELRDMSKRKREAFKMRVLQPLLNRSTYLGKAQVSFSADLLKKSTRTMIALEGVPHWKTGVVKRRIIL
jgi:hypothetical protein